MRGLKQTWKLHLVALLALFCGAALTIQAMPPADEGSEQERSEPGENSPPPPAPTSQGTPEGSQPTAANPVSLTPEPPTPVSRVGADDGELSDANFKPIVVTNPTIVNLQKESQAACARMEDLVSAATKARDALSDTYYGLVDEINALPSPASLEASLSPSS